MLLLCRGKKIIFELDKNGLKIILDLIKFNKIYF